MELSYIIERKVKRMKITVKELMKMSVEELQSLPQFKYDPEDGYLMCEKCENCTDCNGCEEG